METKFTAAPWIINKSNSDGVEFSITDNRISDDKKSIICDLYETFSQEAKANASLIKNSPDLFHALNRLIIAAKPHITYSSQSQLSMRIKEAEFVLNKALGNE